MADDHPSWARIEAALEAARQGEADALDRLSREIARLKDEGAKPPNPGA